MLTLFATLIFGLLLGPVVVLLAAPLTVVTLVLINALYLEDCARRAARLAIDPQSRRQALKGYNTFSNRRHAPPPIIVRAGAERTR